MAGMRLVNDKEFNVRSSKLFESLLTWKFVVDDITSVEIRLGKEPGIAVGQRYPVLSSKQHPASRNCEVCDFSTAGERETRNPLLWLGVLANERCPAFVGQ